MSQSACFVLASYPGLQRAGGRPGAHCVRMRVNLTNFQLKWDILVFLRATITYYDII